jgi:adenine-specific DNA-methyltransferase
MDLRHPFLTEQLIAYIGNKRALLPFLAEIFSRLVPEESDARNAARSGRTFLDPFAGSGAVSRLARLMGYTVGANDWEFYSFVINSCHLGLGRKDLGDLFTGRGGLEAVLAELNGLPAPSEEAAYISRHYAPRSTENADWRTERLFYTRENALVIDAVRQRIEEMYPGTPEGEKAFREKAALLAPLLYEAATHTNTSGVFKACHRGFGGHGKDALRRIMAGIRVRPPVLIDSPALSTVACMDARLFLSGRGADICYLDPPYAAHQYGSNYFMLNTIARWDRPPVSEERGPEGRLLHKAGIREDWTRTRSAFCYPDTALPALREVVAAADCRWLVVSYSNEGLIGLEELCDLLAGMGSLALYSTGYVKYPGGKQSLGRTTRNLEIALVVDRRSRPAAGNVADGLLRPVRIARLLGMAFDPRRVRAAFPVEDGGIVIGRCGGGRVCLPMRHYWRFPADAPPPCFDTDADAERFIAALSDCALRDVKEEIDVLLGIVGQLQDIREKGKLLKVILRLLNKLAHRKYGDVFADELATLRKLSGADPGLDNFRAGLDRIAETAARRSRPPR